MPRHVLTLTLLTSMLLPPAGCGERPGTRQVEGRPGARQPDWSKELHPGMGVAEVRQALGDVVTSTSVERIGAGSASSPQDWNTRWVLSWTLADRDARRERSIGFEAWSSSTAVGRPPDSAFRLRQWEDLP